MELCLQMAIIFVGKQFLLSFVEYQLPRLWKLYNSFKVMTGIAKEERAGKRTPQWIHDFKLADFGDQGLFYEYLEMIIQYGFITIFVSAFPLAPLFALFNNVFELRLDAKKLLVHHRRPVAQRYKAKYSPDGTLQGYANFPLSYFSPADFDCHKQNSTPAVNLVHPEFC